MKRLKMRSDKGIWLLVVLMLLNASAHKLMAQNARFLFSGNITYEKRVNMYAKLKKAADEEQGTWYQEIYDQYRKNQPQFATVNNTLSFNRNVLLYQPVAGQPENRNSFFSDPSVTMRNTIFTNLDEKMSVSQKAVFEETYLLKDSLRKIVWKITDETREIAGYDCRRANALVMDSIYVVAFYTDQIPVSGGPESFTGLPGMILGLALPHENTTWFATRVEDVVVPAANITAPSPRKAKTVNREQLTTTLQSVLSNWGNYGKNMLKLFLL
ncbi:GLPGLI family protein [Olivibacter sitiensis]|uniref:GLPGLI family protein n=1 Tax=Olivibacter sitiensis TaxID=376470 RepID=UPI000414D0BC|nr:GLPGLI family protein [Olivibacter sitiensis]